MGRIQKALAAIVAERNEEGRLKQKDMAKALGCSQAAISYMLTGSRGMSERWIEAFCDYLGVTLGDLEKPTQRLPEPKQLRECTEKLKKLYENSAVPGFKNVTRSIDDWLDAAQAITSAPAAEPVPAEEPPQAALPEPVQPAAEPPDNRYEELPFFDDFRVPEDKPESVTPDDTIRVRKPFRHSAQGSRYVIRVRGDSMEPRIQDGDLVLVDYDREPRPGNTIIAVVNGVGGVKRYLRQKGKVILRSTNPRYADIEIKETDKLRIAGVVLRILEGSV